MSSGLNIKSIKKSYSNNFFGNIYQLIGFEGLVWISSLIYLAVFVNPDQTHFSICPLSISGFEYCPGCGLGNSIALIFNGEIYHSIHSHILGIPALIIISFRIFSLIQTNYRLIKTIK